MLLKFGDEFCGSGDFALFATLGIDPRSGLAVTRTVCR
jgi:hypothetical protein